MFGPLVLLAASVGAVAAVSPTVRKEIKESWNKLKKSVTEEKKQEEDQKEE